jgi:hypothetical protein
MGSTGFGYEKPNGGELGSRSFAFSFVTTSIRSIITCTGV